MSTTYYLCCPEVKLKLWIGQRSFNDYWIYSEDKEVMNLLEKFLYLTQGKNIVFLADYDDEILIDCVEFTGEQV